jgi:hypothetical protein
MEECIVGVYSFHETGFFPAIYYIWKTYHRYKGSEVETKKMLGQHKKHAQNKRMKTTASQRSDEDPQRLLPPNFHAILQAL